MSHLVCVKLQGKVIKNSHDTVRFRAETKGCACWLVHATQDQWPGIFALPCFAKRVLLMICIGMPCGVVMNITPPPSPSLSVSPSVCPSVSITLILSRSDPRSHGARHYQWWHLLAERGTWKNVSTHSSPLHTVHTHKRAHRHTHTPQHTNKWDTYLNVI